MEAFWLDIIPILTALITHFCGLLSIRKVGRYIFWYCNLIALLIQLTFKVIYNPVHNKPSAFTILHTTYSDTDNALYFDSLILSNHTKMYWNALTTSLETYNTYRMNLYYGSAYLQFRKSATRLNCRQIIPGKVNTFVVYERPRLLNITYISQECKLLGVGFERTVSRLVADLTPYCWDQRTFVPRKMEIFQFFVRFLGCFRCILW